MGRRILVADDDPMTGTVLAAVLDEQGFEVVLAADRDEAHRALRDRHPDVAVLGDALARGDGLLATARSDAGTEQVPVVLLGPVTGIRSPLGPPGAGIQAHLQRPCSPLHLVEVLEALVDGGAGTASASSS